MADPSQTFSESWYRIADKKICLRPSVKARRQNFRGERWIVLEDSFTNTFFRLRPAAFEFVARLRPDRTVEQVWRECLDKFPDDAPGQEAVIQLLSQLYLSNLLQYEMAADSAQLFERFKKRRQREVRAQFMNLMFMRFPLLDPDRFLVRAMPIVGKLISPLGAVLWIAVVGWALKVAVDNFDALREQSQSVLAPENLVLLFAGMVVIKALHEFGHAFFCRKFGGEVHTMGVMLMIFTPVPYMDATSSWSFRSRWQRLLVGGAGMIVELFFAAIATFIWAQTGQGAVHSLAYNILFVASVSTVVFNINPLLRFDGYYMLSDLLEIPNLHQRSLLLRQHLVEHYLFGVKKSESPARSRKETAWLTVFGATSGVYRVIVFTGVLFVVADKFLIIGILMAVVCLISWATVPAVKFVQYLAASPRLERVRSRAIAVSAGFCAVVILCLQVIPFPNHFRAPGVLLAAQRTDVIAEATGYIDAIVVQSGSQVRAGEPLMRLKNPEMELELAGALARQQEIEVRLLKAMNTDVATLKPLMALQAATTSRLQKLQTDQALLILRARHDGVWVAPGVESYAGRWLRKGTRLGLLVNPSSFEFAATVQQEDADALFGRKTPTAEIRLKGQPSPMIRVANWKVIPGDQKILPSPALGWAGGGEVAISTDDPQGRKAAEPFFEVLAPVPKSEAIALLDGRSGRIRFDLEPEPLLTRWLRRLWQLLQKRYQL